MWELWDETNQSILVKLCKLLLSSMKFLFNKKLEKAKKQSNTIQVFLELKFFIYYVEFHDIVVAHVSISGFAQ